MTTTITDLHGRSLLRETDLTAAEFLYLVELGGTGPVAEAGRTANAAPRRQEHRADLREDIDAYPVSI